MPLTKGFRDEDNERYKNTLQRLIGLTFDPEHHQIIDENLNILGMSLQELATIDEHDLLTKLYELKFNFENAETFADFLAKSGFGDKARSVYNYVQQSSGTFSLGIFNKINAIGS